ncbi:MAG: branched-chain amino acid ABC transporter permease [Alphaproteobacteria bacterium]
MSFLKSLPSRSLILFCILVGLGFAMPTWGVFLVTIAFAKGLVALGNVAMMRGGLVSFGQGLYYCTGAYVAGFMAIHLGFSDIFLLCLAGVFVSTIVGAILGPILSTYRGIFFAMLSLAVSMILYGALSKATALGSTDGLTLPGPTFLGFAPEGRALSLHLYIFTVTLVVAAGTLMRMLFDSERGLITLAIKDNELRVEYLGASVRATMSVNFVIAAALGGLGGVIAGLAIGHVDPEYAYWTTSGEFVFVAILAGHFSVGAIFIASVILELVRSFSSLYFPNTWQLALGLFLLLVILLLPDGLGSLMKRWSRATAAFTKKRI